MCVKISFKYVHSFGPPQVFCQAIPEAGGIITSSLIRVWDLEKQEKQLRHFQQSSGVVNQWIDNARQRQDTLQSTKFSNIQAVMEHLNQQKVGHCTAIPPKNVLSKMVSYNSVQYRD